MRVVVLGASPKPERYANKAVHLLLEHGYSVLPVHPAAAEIAGQNVYAGLRDIETAVHTVTVYLSASQSALLAADLMALRPRRVIFNPGAENRELQHMLQENGIEVEEACTLVLLNTGQF
ncbi:CoA-binding protein [Verrucomicrobia bacterium S94]|nr:CoA-binding protein [Verrucomicrobia bacterium S94]